MAVLRGRARQLVADGAAAASRRQRAHGVFATRSPFRPNALGLSCVRLIGIEHSEEHGAYLRIAGADMMDGTPVYDVKPYIPYADCHPDALSGFAPDPGAQLRVECPDELHARRPRR